MKFFLPLALLVAAASAADSESECAAEVIVQTCLESETAKFDACGNTDYDCQCAAQQAISTYALALLRPLFLPIPAS